MLILRKFIDRLRTLVRVRVRRQVEPAHGKPSLGSSIVKDRFRIRLKHPIDDELWLWLSKLGWRAMPVHNNRRRYSVISERAFEKLVRADVSMRPMIYAHLTEGRKKRRV
jgi:hypothetical protein